MAVFGNLIVGIIRDISVVDIIDILIVSYVIYRALVFIEGTRAFNSLRGLGIILLFLVVTKDLNFNTVTWILSNALPTGFLALVVIFQQELRLALEDIGKGSFLGQQLVPKDAIPEMVDSVCKTLEACSKARIGALIVFEQGIGLKDFIENGIYMHSEISSELLTTIFKPFTPLHDGAVVIKGKYIEAAACFLPTPSRQSEVSKELGSRHRAAIGLTEITDALVFVVSEETGQISKAKGGKLVRDLTIERSRKLIEFAFSRMNRRKRKVFSAK